MKRTLTTLSLSIVMLFVFAQYDQSNYKVNAPEIPFLSPEAASLGKYGEIPVSDYTGVPDINIPLYTVKSGELELPISLSYHASGIKVNQESTWVGLGWDLMAGGCINRVVSGGYDENVHNMTPYEDARKVLYMSSAFHEPSVEEHEGYINQTFDYYTQSLLDELSRRDYEPDIYQANFCGMSFSFFIDQDTHEAIVIGKVNGNYRIECNKDNGYICQWKITDNLGIEYYFESEGIETSYSEKAQSGYYSSWFITKILHPQKGYIYFSYHKSEYIYILPPQYEYYTYFSEIPNEMFGYDIPENNSENLSGDSPPALPSHGHYMSMNYYDCKINKPYLHKITTSDCELEFFSSKGVRTDIGGGRRLDSLLIRSTLKNETLKKVVLYNDSYFESATHNVPNEPQYYTLHYNGDKKFCRLCLDSLKVNDGIYTFSYNGKGCIPPKTSYAQDFWGYYNGKSNKSLICSSNIYDTIESFDQANRYVDTLCIKTGILTEIGYPTKGRTKFVYESNVVDYSPYGCKFPTAENATSYRLSKKYNGKSYGAGLRIKEILNYDENNTLVMHECYDYQGGRLKLPLPQINEDYTIITNSGSSLTYKKYSTFTIYSSASVPAFTSANAVPIGYDCVRVKKNGSVTETCYSNLYFAETDKDIPNAAFFTNLDNGNMMSRRIFDINGELMSEHLWTYKIYNSDILANMYATDFLNGNQVSFFYYLGTRYRIVFYPFLVQRQVPTSETISERRGNSMVTTNITYDYNSQYLLSSVTKSQPNGMSQQYQIKYPADYNDHVSDSLVNRNMLNYPIETSLSIGGNVIERSRNNYSLVYGKPLLTERQWASGTNDYQTRLSLRYDEHGNVVQAMKNDTPPVTYLWGYNHTLPVMKIEGLSYDQVTSMIPSNLLTGLNGHNVESCAEAIGQHTVFKQHLLSWYKFIPLVGLASEHLPNGNYTSYEYDVYGRLKKILDRSNRTKATYDYNYVR